MLGDDRLVSQKAVADDVESPTRSKRGGSLRDEAVGKIIEVIRRDVRQNEGGQYVDLGFAALKTN